MTDTPTEEPPKKKPRIKSRGHPLMIGRTRGVYYPELVGRVPGYPKTLEKHLERVEIMRQQIKLYNAEGIATRRGVPDGFAGRKAELKRYRQTAAAKAEKIVTVMAEDHKITDPRAIKAMKEAVEIFELRDEANVPVHKAPERISAIRTVLEWTTPKPAAKSDISVSKAEDWLAGLAARSD